MTWAAVARSSTRATLASRLTLRRTFSTMVGPAWARKSLVAAAPSAPVAPSARAVRTPSATAALATAAAWYQSPNCTTARMSSSRTGNTMTASAAWPDSSRRTHSRR